VSDSLTSFIDAHCHLAEPKLNQIREEILERAQNQGITEFIQGGIDPQDWFRQKALRFEFPGKIHCSFGLHPWWVATHTETEFQGAFTLLEQALADAIALGETGLDFLPRFPESTHPLQLQAFEQQLELAHRARLPLILHIVKAHEPALALLKRLHPEWSGILHSFSGSADLAHRYTDLGLLISIGAAVLREGNRQIEKAITSLNLNQLVIESDSPDQLSEPADIFLVAKKVAMIKKVSPKEVLLQSAQNLRRAFSLFSA